jgi:hypothetical protein
MGDRRMTARIPDGARIKTSPPWLKEKKEAKPGKYKNEKTDGFDSKREKAYAEQLELLKHADEPRLRVVSYERQVKYELIPKQEGERAVHYIADFYVSYADGHSEVVDVKSPVTRKLPAYIIKRKLMLLVHGIRVKEII